MSAWINVEYYVLSSMPSLALNSIISQNSSRQAVRQAGNSWADRQLLFDINWWFIIVKVTIPYHISEKGRERALFRFRVWFEFWVKSNIEKTFEISVEIFQHDQLLQRAGSRRWRDICGDIQRYIYLWFISHLDILVGLTCVRLVSTEQRDSALEMAL